MVEAHSSLKGVASIPISIHKPRNNYSNMALKRAMGNFNLKDKRKNLSSIGFGAKSVLKHPGEDEQQSGIRKIRTVDMIPKAITIMHSKLEMGTIDEEKDDQESTRNQEAPSKPDNGKLDMGDDSDSDDESIDGEGEDLEALEMKLCQDNVEEKKSMDDLIDTELNELLKVCKNLRPSTP
jgi:hypothetical protein